MIADGLTLWQGAQLRHHVGVSSPAGGGSAAQERDHVPGDGGRGRTRLSGGVG